MSALTRDNIGEIVKHFATDGIEPKIKETLLRSIAQPENDALFSKADAVMGDLNPDRQEHMNGVAADVLLRMTAGAALRNE